MSEKQNMLESRPYNAAHPELKQERLRARKLLWQLNRSNPEDEAERAQILHELLPNAADSKPSRRFCGKSGWVAV